MTKEHSSVFLALRSSSFLKCFFFLLIATAALIHSNADILAHQIKVPFTSLDTEHHHIELEFIAQELSSTLLLDNSLTIGLPSECIPLRSLEFNDSLLIVLRRIHFDTLSFGLWNEKGGFRQILLPPPYSEWIFRAGTRFRDKAAFVFFDTSSKSNVVILADPASESLLLPSTALPLPNVDIDSRVLTASTDEAIYVTINQSGFIIRPNNDTLSFQYLSRVTSRKWVELKSNGTNVFGLGVETRVTDEVQKSNPAIFTVVNLSTAQIIRATAFPFELNLSSGSVETTSLQTKADLARIFRNDLLTGENSGLLFFGTGQSEGRVSWAAAYYLKSWIDILRQWPGGKPNFSFLNNLKPDLKVRLDLEMYLLDRLLDLDRPGLYAKSYTLHREPKQFAVHLGRVLQLFKRYLFECPNPIQLPNYDKLRQDTASLTNAVEEIVTASPGDPSAAPGVTYLKLRKGEPCQFDGTPEPFNHQDDWAAGVMMHEPLSFASSPTGQICKSIFNVLMEEGPLKPPPTDHSWYYWWGVARTGWTAEDDISGNTPAWPGYKNKATPGYKTQDAQALFTARAYFPELIDFDLDEWVCQCIKKGAILPLVMESFAAEGKRCVLPSWLAVQQMRAGGSWQMQSATWALAALAETEWLDPLEPPLQIHLDSQTITLSILTKPAHSYDLLAADTLLSPVWQLQTNITGDGAIKFFDEKAPFTDSRFFKALEKPVLPASP